MKGDVAEGKFYKFLRDFKIVTEKKQMDEMFKQCIFISKKDQNKAIIAEGAPMTYVLFQQLFAKPLMLIAMENALSLME